MERTAGPLHGTRWRAATVAHASSAATTRVVQATVTAARRRPEHLPQRRCAPRSRVTRGVFYVDTRQEEDDARAPRALLEAPPAALAALLPPAEPEGAARAALPPPPPPPAALPPPGPTVLELIQATPSFRRFNRLIAERPFLREDWQSFINRPWVAGLVSALLSHEQGAAMMAREPDLGRAVRGVIDAVDDALTEDDLRWMVATLDQVDRHPAVYTIVDAMEVLVDADAITWLDALARRAVTPGRLAAAADVAAAVLTPCAVRRRRARRAATPEGEYVAAHSRGAKWGIEAHRRGWKEARARAAASRGGSPTATLDRRPGDVSSPLATLDALASSPLSTLDLLGSTLDLLGDPTATLDAYWTDLLGGQQAEDEGAAAAVRHATREGATPQCAVNQLVDALRTFWTPERIDAYLDAVDAALPAALPLLQDLAARGAAAPGAQARVLAALNALEAVVPARAVADVGAALVSGMSRERVEYGARAADAVLPPPRLEAVAAALVQALTPGRLDALGAALPQLLPLLPRQAALRAAAGRAAALARAPAAAEWEAALEAALPASRLAAWCASLDGAASAERLGRALDAAAALLAPELALPARLRAALDRRTPVPAAALTPSAPATTTGAEQPGAATAADAATGAACPSSWPRRDLEAVAGLVDAVMSPPALRALAELGDRATEPQRVRAAAAALDRALPPAASLDVEQATKAERVRAEAGAGARLADAALRAAVRSGVAARCVRALAAAVGQPGGADDAARLADAAAAPAGAWGPRIAAAPAALRLWWSFHLHLAFPRAA